MQPLGQDPRGPLAYTPLKFIPVGSMPPPGPGAPRRTGYATVRVSLPLQWRNFVADVRYMRLRRLNDRSAARHRDLCTPTVTI